MRSSFSQVIQSGKISCLASQPYLRKKAACNVAHTAYCASTMGHCRHCYKIQCTKRRKNPKQRMYSNTLKWKVKRERCGKTPVCFLLPPLAPPISRLSSRGLLLSIQLFQHLSFSTSVTTCRNLFSTFRHSLIPARVFFIPLSLDILWINYWYFSLAAVFL